MIELLFASAAAAPSLGGPAEIWAAIVKDFSNIGSPSALSAFLQVLMIDVVLAGDNAIVVGALAAGLPADQRKKVIAIGVIAALVLRVAFALMVTWLLGIVGLIFAGGVLLLWVAWRMYRDIGADHGSDSPGSPEITGDEDSGIKSAKSFVGAAWAVAIADVSMSLDNVLAVAGAAKDHPGIMIVGLIFAVALMGIAANIIAKYIERYRWIAWIGLAVIVYVAGKMIYEGWIDPQLGLGKFIAPMIGG
ncbi:TerC family protein [Sphingorhabdus sp.]|uniref:TerC family protein n=1 Tax=Sphingorhabdus sp. TaxID=1902408 RepID=UPI0032B7D071